MMRRTSMFPLGTGALVTDFLGQQYYYPGVWGLARLLRA